jgi:hypothetical protein
LNPAKIQSLKLNENQDEWLCFQGISEEIEEDEDSLLKCNAHILITKDWEMRNFDDKE